MEEKKLFLDKYYLNFSICENLTIERLIQYSTCITYHLTEDKKSKHNLTHRPYNTLNMKRHHQGPDFLLDKKKGEAGTSAH